MSKGVLMFCFAVIVAGCGSTDSATLEEACAQLDACRDDVTLEQCLDLFAAAVTPADCYKTMRDAPCEDHQQPTAYRDICFPPCFAPAQQCVNDSLLACIDWGGGEFRRSLLTCEGICEMDGLVYTGRCSTLSPGGQVSEEEVCWCVPA